MQMAKIGAHFIPNKSQRDLCTWPIEPEEEATLESVFGTLKAVARPKESK